MNTTGPYVPPGTAKKAAWRTSVAGALTNLLLVAIKGGGGWFSGSQALIADAIHSLADLLTDIISFVAVWLGRSEADDTHPYGHGKFETFGTLILSLFLLATALGLGWHLVSSFLAGKAAHNLGVVALVAAGFSVLLNEALFRYCLYEGKKTDSKPIIANAWHHRADGLSSVAVFAGIVLNLLGFAYGDYLAAAIVVLFLIKVAYSLGREAFDELVDAAMPETDQEAIGQTIADTDGVLDCHMLRGRRIGGDTVVDVHVDVNPLISVSEGHRIAEMVEYNIMEKHPKVTDVTVHIDPAEHQHEPPKAAAAPSRDEMEKVIKNIIEDICPKADVAGITLHFIDHKTHAEIVFNAFPGGKKKRDALKEALLRDGTPFSKIRLLEKL